MARSGESATFIGPSGRLHTIDLPLPSGLAEQETAGVLKRLQPETPVVAALMAPPDTDPAEPKRPAVNADKAVWVAYAIAVDDTLTEADAAAVTKAELIERYGAR